MDIQLTTFLVERGQFHDYSPPRFWLSFLVCRTGPVATYLRTSKARSNFALWTYTNVIGVVRNGAQITGVRTNYTQYGGDGYVHTIHVGRISTYMLPSALFH
jgi:nicotinamide riboside transporter PnuC